MKETLSTAESLLGDLSGFKGFKREATELSEELGSYCKDQFESWVSEMMTAIDDPKQPLRYTNNGISQGYSMTGYSKSFPRRIFIQRKSKSCMNKIEAPVVVLEVTRE